MSLRNYLYNFGSGENGCNEGIPLLKVASFVRMSTPQPNPIHLPVIYE